MVSSTPWPVPTYHLRSRHHLQAHPSLIKEDMLRSLLTNDDQIIATACSPAEVVAVIQDRPFVDHEDYIQ